MVLLYILNSHYKRYKPDLQDAKKLMRFVYENYQECKTQAKITQKWIQQEFSYENIGAQLSDILK